MFGSGEKADQIELPFATNKLMAFSSSIGCQRILNSKPRYHGDQTCKECYLTGPSQGSCVEIIIEKSIEKQNKTKQKMMK